MSHHDNQRNIFVVLPAFNEGPVLKQVIKDLLSFGYSLIVVDDGSTISQLSFLDGMPVYFIRHRINLGQGAALQTGIEFALSKNADCIITFDADGQHQASDIPPLLEMVTADHFDIILGSRFIEGSGHNMPRRRKILLQLARYINFLFTGLLLTDAHNGLRVMNRKAASALQLSENGMAHATEILTIVKKRKLRYAEAPVHIQYTDHSRRKGQNLWDAFRIFFDLLLNKIFG